MEFSYQIIDTRTGQIVKTDLLSSGGDDYIEYARYDGDPKELLASDPTPEWYKNPPKSPEIAQLQLNLELLKGIGRVIDSVVKKTDIFYKRSNLKPSEELFEPIIDDLSDSVYSSIFYYFKNLN